jgi:PAS domain S-box-containing protein
MTKHTEDAAAKVLILAPTGRDNAVISRILRNAGFFCQVCANIGTLLVGLNTASTAVIAEEALNSAGAVSAMQDWLGAQPPWSDFPFVFLSRPINEEDQRRTEVGNLFANITVLERPLRSDTLVRAVASSARARQRQLDAARLLEERARVESELRHAELRLRLALRAARLAEVTFNLADGSVSHSAAFAELFGYPPDQRMTLEEVRARYHPDDLQRVPQERSAFLASDQDFYEVQKRIVWPAGEVRWVYGRGQVQRDGDGRPISVTAVYLDETDRKNAEAALRESEEHYRHAAELNPQVPWTATPDGQLDRVAERWREWTGISGLGDSWGQGLHPDDLGYTVAAWGHSVATGEPYDVEHRVKLRSGDYRWARSRAFPRRDDNGRIVKWYGSTEDIHERKSAETALLRLNETLEARVVERTGELLATQAALAQAQKMEAVGQLTGGVAHDFNNLLMVLSGGLDMLVQPKDPERRDRVLSAMRQAVDRGATLTRQLLTFSRREPLKPEPIALDQRVSAMEELLARSLRGDIRVEMEFAPRLWLANADPTQLELAVLNLAVNARDAMPHGGTLTIRGENASPVEAEELEGDFVRLSVCDSGVGMKADVLNRAFEPFFTTKDVGKGSGLGLAQVYGFAKRSGGAVHIESTPGQGTRVMLLLPRSLGKAASIEPQPARPSGSASNSLSTRSATVLLVEDDEEVASLAADMIDQLGYDVIRVANGPAALGALADGRAVDIVFSDIMMPGGMSGTELAGEIMRRRPDLPVVLTTGYDAQAALLSEAPPLPLLRKPYRLDALESILAAALRGRSDEPAASRNSSSG